MQPQVGTGVRERTPEAGPTSGPLSCSRTVEPGIQGGSVPQGSLARDCVTVRAAVPSLALHRNWLTDHLSSKRAGVFCPHGSIQRGAVFRVQVA